MQCIRVFLDYSQLYVRFFKLIEKKLRIIVRDIGGGFGTKVVIHPEDLLIVYAARKLNLTVKWTATRSEEL